MPDVSYELSYELLRLAIMGDPGMGDRVLGVLALVNLWGNILQYLVRDMVLAFAPGSIFTIICLVACFIVSCSLL